MIKTILLLTAVAAFGIVSPIPALDRAMSQLKTGLTQEAHSLQVAPNGPEEEALLREIQALPDSAYRAPANQQSALSNQQF